MYIEHFQEQFKYYIGNFYCDVYDIKKHIP